MRYAEVTDMKRIFGGTLTLKNGRIDKYQFDEGYCQAEKYIYNTSQDDFTFCYYDQNHIIRSEIGMRMRPIDNYARNDWALGSLSKSLGKGYLRVILNVLNSHR